MNSLLLLASATKRTVLILEILIEIDYCYYLPQKQSSTCHPQRVKIRKICLRSFLLLYIIDSVKTNFFGWAPLKNTLQKIPLFLCDRKVAGCYLQSQSTTQIRKTCNLNLIRQQNLPRPRTKRIQIVAFQLYSNILSRVWIAAKILH